MDKNNSRSSSKFKGVAPACAEASAGRRFNFLVFSQECATQSATILIQAVTTHDIFFI